MQQLSKAHVTQSFQKRDDTVELALPLPASPLQAEQLTDAIAAHFGFIAGPADWGADRYQVAFRAINNDSELRCILCVEWLCEAIWLEPTGTTTLDILWQALSGTALNND